MIEYRSVILANRFDAPQVIIELDRQPLDLTYAAFILAEMQTGNYEECFASIITQMDLQGELRIFYSLPKIDSQA